jgi:SAM-dependent methyltransferase
MEPEVKRRLLELNYLFYQTFAIHFSATRQRIQPGVRKILKNIPINHRILDVGCGNGNLWCELLRRGHYGHYIGVDFSPDLLQLAARMECTVSKSRPDNKSPVFFLLDLTKQDWELPDSLPYDSVFAFAFLHHIPSLELRLTVLQKIKQLIAPTGMLYLSVWQFLNSPKLRTRIQNWSEIGIPKDKVDPDDYLLDWRSGGTGFRYVHHFSEQELSDLASLSDFHVKSIDYSDGREHNLGLYQIWEPMK